MESVVRRAAQRDAPLVAGIHIRTWQRAYRGQLPDAFLDAMGAQFERRTSFWADQIRVRAGLDDRAILVAEEDGTVVGFATCGPSEDEPRDEAVGEVYAIYVEPDHWGSGHGRALFGAATAVLTDAGFREATLWVLATNARARRFYEIAGWRTDGATKTEHRGDVALHEVRYRTLLPPAA
jgi:GNAT superfamily N-acetyltransferase